MLLRIAVFFVCAAWAARAPALDLITADSLLEGDPALMGREAADQGITSLIWPLECGDSNPIATFEMLDDRYDVEWVTGGIYLHSECAELEKDPEYADKIPAIEKAIQLYNDAVAKRAKEIRLFNVYMGDYTEIEASHSSGLRARVESMLNTVTGGNLYRIDNISADSTFEPSRVFAGAYGSVFEIKQVLATNGWQRNTCPSQMLKAMHWYPAPDEGCYTGTLDGHPSILFVRSRISYVILIVALSIKDE